MKSLGYMFDAFGCRLADRQQQRVESGERSQRVAIRARYDAAQTGDDNRRIWAAADMLSADEANNPGVRMILRNRAEYVVSNNPRCRGMVRTLARYVIGTGPQLQLMMGDGPAAQKLAVKIEASFAEWAREVKLAKKLRMCRKARATRGEVFLYYFYNPKLRHAVKLDLKAIDTSRITGFADGVAGHNFDGVCFDVFDNPIGYVVHPPRTGSQYGYAGGFNRLPIRAAADLGPSQGPFIGTFVGAEFMDHYFDDADRPEQHRGIPDITPAISVFEEGRRFRSAVLSASETAASYAMTLESQASGVTEDDLALTKPMDAVEIERGMMTTLPKGWKMSQTRAEQPTTTYREFARELLSEVARCIDMPLTIAALDSSDSNLSAAYLDFQVFGQAIKVDREDMTFIPDNIVDKWLTIAADPSVGLFGALPRDQHLLAAPHKWFWPSLGKHADPLKVASATDINLRNGTTTYAEVYGDDGKDWELMMQQRAREKARMIELGLTPADMLPGGNLPQMSDDPADQPKPPKKK